jgi:galactose-1-phosphate uridylyltransferase
MKYLASVEQITGLFLVDVMPEDAAKQIRDFHQKNEI